MPRKKLDHEYYVDYVNKCWNEADDAFKPQKRVLEELWQLYQNKQDWSKKAGWQSKNFIPKIFMQVEKSSGEVKRAMIQTRKLFKFELDDIVQKRQIAELEDFLADVDPDSPGAAEMMGILENRIRQLKRKIDSRERKMSLREKEFKRSLGNTNLTNIYSEMTKVAFLLGLGVPKVLWDDDNRACTFENVDIMNLRTDPTYRPFSNKRPGYQIERIEMDLAEFRRMVKKNPKQYIKSEVNKIQEESMEPFDDKLKKRTRQNLGDYTPVNKKIVLYQFWGDVINKDNDNIEENLLMVTANKKYLVRKQKNPFRHKKYPYIMTMPLVYPHRGMTGISLVAPQVRMQYTLNNLVNAYLDQLNYIVNPIFEYNPSNLANPKMMTAVYPGKKVENNLPAGQQAVSQLVVTPVGREALLAFDLIKQQMEEGSNVNEFISGSPAKKSKTATEVELKTAQTKGLFDVIARDLEANSLKPLLEMAYDLYVQFGGYEKRKGNYNFVVGGISMIVTQQEKRQGLGQAMALALQAPQLTQMTDIADLWHKFLSSHNLEDVFVSPDKSKEIMTMEQQGAVQKKAEADAEAMVAQMPPEEIARRAG